MLHHVALEVTTDEVTRSGEFWEALGFERVPAPPEIAGYVTWYQRGDTQIHLIETDSPIVPQAGHPAVVARDFHAALDRLAAAGFDLEPRRELWDAPRATAIAPGGHRVEVMGAPPPPIR